MHMADILVSPATAVTMYAASSCAAGTSLAKLKNEDITSRAPLMGVTGAFIFALQMVNFTIPGTGSSGHLCGAVLASALLGPYAGFLTMISVLLIQALLFSDGGIMALGCNIWNMAFYGCILSYFLVWKPIIKKVMSKKSIAAAAIISGILSLQLGAFSVVLETLVSGITELPFTSFLVLMQPIHLVIGLVEGLITSAILCFVYDKRPDALYDYNTHEPVSTFRPFILIVSACVLLTGGVLSNFASDKPDGLEWSIEHTAGSSFLPDAASGYEVLNLSLSGVGGSLAVVILITLIALLVRKIGRTNTVGQNQ